TSGLFMDWSFSVQLLVFCFEKYSRTDEKPVATGLSSQRMLDLTPTHIYFIFGPWIIKNGQELVEIWRSLHSPPYSYRNPMIPMIPIGIRPYSNVIFTSQIDMK
ncbi:hypothetical protein L208DRAFT_1231168, partial [Tricholoma matsutake]